jgi:sec-independent protein translocase protein TatB
MFDVGFSELLVIGVVALIVIGPERLPKVARTAGLLLGRMQRYVATIKSDISQEIQLEELRKSGQILKDSLQETGQHITDEINHTRQDVEAAVNPAAAELPAAEDRPAVAEPEPESLQGELALEPVPAPSAGDEPHNKNNHTV